MKKLHPQRGFSLIELMVSLSIFSIIIVTVAGAYFTVVSLDKQTRTLNELANNLSFVTDGMSRSIRSGSNWCGAEGGNAYCTNITGNQYSDFGFTDQNGCTIQYFLSNGQLMENESGGNGCSSFSNLALTEPGVTITRLNFYIYSPGRGSGANAFVTYIISGQITADSRHTESFSVESSSAERTINL